MPLLFAYGINRLSHDVAQILTFNIQCILNQKRYGHFQCLDQKILVNITE